MSDNEDVQCPICGSLTQRRNVTEVMGESSFYAPPCSAELPATDGYYWMKNLVDEGRAIWRIVNVFSRGHPDRNGMQRIARDCCSVLTKEDLADWQGVEFHGPIHPPNGELTDAGPVTPASRETHSRHSVQ